MTIVSFSQQITLILSVLFSTFLSACSSPPEKALYYHVKTNCPGCHSHARTHVYTMIEKLPSDLHPREGLITRGIRGTGYLIEETEVNLGGEVYKILRDKTITVINEDN